MGLRNGGFGKLMRGKSALTLALTLVAGIWLADVARAGGFEDLGVPVGKAGFRGALGVAP